MNPSLLPTLQKLHEEATQGPWIVNGRYIGVTNHASFIGECKDANQNWCNDRMSVANARLIAELRTLLPEIISSLQGAEEMREALERLVTAEEASCDRFTAKEIDGIEAAMELAKAALAKFSTPAPQSLGKKN